MSDAHRPTLSLGRTRLTIFAVALLALAVAAILGLVARSGDDGGASAARRPAGAAATSPVAVPAADVSSAAASSAAATTPVASTPASPKPVASKPVSKPAFGTPKQKPLTYVVKSGDNLSVIAAWFHLHGYGDLYERNMAAIGDDPNLIHPGLRITVSEAGVSTSH